MSSARHWRRRPGPESRPPVLVILLHGWPESWYSWRHQLRSLSSAGYAVCAPDMRGYGGTDSPYDLPAYDVRTLALDVVGVAERCGYNAEEKFVVVGHDFGSYLAWHVALLHPDRVAGVCGMSVPWAGHSPRHCGTLDELRRRYGDCLPGAGAPAEERARAQFHYMLHHCLPGAAEEYGRNVQEALYRLYTVGPGVECEKGTPEVTDPRMFPPAAGPPEAAPPGRLDARSAPGFWARLPRPKSLPSWLCKYDLDYYASEFSRAGFAGGLKWYQALDMNWARTRHLAGKRISPPALFIAGSDDRVIGTYGGPDRVREQLQKNCSKLMGCVLMDGAGHWIQQERAEEVDGALIEFLAEVVSSSLWGTQQNTSVGADARARL